MAERSKQHVLLVDDDAHIREVVRYALEKEGVQVSEAENGLAALRLIPVSQPDVMVLDIMMPEMNGLDVCREVRKTSRLPILFLSSKDSELDKILGLELGGDDYVSKPFSPRELVARIKVMLRRLEENQTTSEENVKLLAFGTITLNPSNYQVTCQNAPLSLTTTEFNLLQTFLQRPNKVFTRDELVLADIFKDIISDRTIDSHIRRLRQKFSTVGCSNVVETVHGFGYKLGDCNAS